MAKLNPAPFAPVKATRLRVSAGVRRPETRAELLDFISTCEAEARRTGYDLSGALWEVVEAMFEKAKGGDVKAARLVLDRFFGSVNRAPVVDLSIGVDASTGPPIPSASKLRDTVAELIRLGKRDEPFEIVDAEIVTPGSSGSEPSELDELLS